MTEERRAARAADTRGGDLPRWLSSTSVARIGAALVVLTLLLAASFLWYEKESIEQRDQQRVELLARVLEDHANRTFDTIDIAMATLADNVGNMIPAMDAIRLGPVLVHAQQGLPFLRSLSLLDEQGRILASSAIDSVDLIVDRARVPLHVGSASEVLGTLVAGRDLSDATQGSPFVAAEDSPRGFLPLTRRIVPPAGGPTMHLVAALNPDFFSNAYGLLLKNPYDAAALVHIDGTLQAATESIRVAPGRSTPSHRFFADYLPSREQGSDIGTGLGGGKVVTAFRTARHLPLAVVVERDYAAVEAALARIAGWVVGVCAIVLTVMGCMIVMAWRSLRGHEAVRAALDQSRRRVESSERSLRSLVESVHELIFRTDARGRIRFVNGRWDQITGRNGSDALGHKLSALCLPEDQAGIDALFARGAARGADAKMVKIRTPQGDLRTLEVSVAAVREADGGLSGFAGFAVDVSERQLVRKRLEAQLDFTARLLEISPTPMFVKDTASRFIMVNQAWLELMAVSRDQAIGTTSIDLFGDEAAPHHEHDQRLLLSEDRVRYESRLSRPGRSPRDTVVTKVRFTEADGSAAGIIGSIIDVTEFREAERVTRIARDAAESANRAKSEFVANITHELRTPLQSIIGFSELGQELADTHPDFKEMFGDIYGGGRRMLALVNDLLDVSKLESRVGTLTLERANIVALAGEVVRELHPLANPRRLEILLPTTPTTLSADIDPPRLQQVLRNILANAIRFAPAGSRIDVAFDSFGAEGVGITVRDHGPGIPPDELESIFDPFVQSSRTRDGSGGTGLGLTISRKIIGAHGGRISARNAPDGGAILSIRLPAPAETPSTRQSTPAPQTETSDAG